MTASARLALGIDTSGSRPGAAIAASDAGGARDILTLGVRYTADGQSRGETLADCIESLLAAAKVKVCDLSAIGVVRGPGSYTAIRIGLSLARGLALVDGIPVVGFGSLELMALAGKQSDGVFGCVRRATGGQFYAAVYARQDTSIDEVRAPSVIGADALPAWLGEAAPTTVYADPDCFEPLRAAWQCNTAVALEPAHAEPAEALVRTTLLRFVTHGGTRAVDVLPLYVSPVTARPNRNRVAMIPDVGE